MFELKKVNGAYVSRIPVRGNGDDVKTLAYAVGAYGFLVPWNRKVTAAEFAALISDYYVACPRVTAILEALKRAGG